VPVIPRQDTACSGVALRIEGGRLTECWANSDTLLVVYYWVALLGR